jgi:hypothetical protein
VKERPGVVLPIAALVLGAAAWAVLVALALRWIG